YGGAADPELLSHFTFGRQLIAWLQRTIGDRLFDLLHNLFVQARRSNCLIHGSPSVSPSEQLNPPHGSTGRVAIPKSHRLIKISLGLTAEQQADTLAGLPYVPARGGVKAASVWLSDLWTSPKTTPSMSAIKTKKLAAYFPSGNTSAM